jgi:hypothetical protein
VKGYSIKVVDRHDDVYISIFIRHTTFLESGGFFAECRIGRMDGILESQEFRLVYA